MPAAGTQQYDPTASSPYQAPAMPQPNPVMPSPLPQQGPEINGAVRKSGAVATIADGILRGFMQGKQMAEVKKTMQVKKRFDDLQNSYNQDAQVLLQMKQSGVDPNSQEYKTALSSVQGSWGALIDEYGKHLEPQDDGKKKSKAKKVEGGILGAFQSKDPMQVSNAWYQIAKQAGPPVMSQLATLNTPEAQAAQKARQLATQNAVGGEQHIANLTEAQTVRDSLNKIPHEQWTDAQKQQYEQATQMLQQPEQYKPGDEAKKAADDLVRKMQGNPDYKLSEQDKQIFEAAGVHINPDKKIQVTQRGEIIESDKDGNFKVVRGPQKEYEPRGAGRGAAGDAEDKNYRKWDEYYKKHNPNLSDEERDHLVRRKVEGISQSGEGQLVSDAITEPRKFDNEVLTAAIDRVRKLPEYSKMENFDDALANIVGQDEDGYAYNPKIGAASGGKYSGNVDQKGLEKLERDLQMQIRQVLNDPKANVLSQADKRAAMGRMRPLTGPAAKAGGNSQASPPAQAAPPPAQASSPAPQGGPKPTKGIVRKKAFLDANPGSTDADWNATKPQLQQQGFDVRE